MKQFLRRGGFTIVELLIVISVIGIIATVVIVAYNGVQQSARDTSSLSDAAALDAIETSYGLKKNVGGKAWYSVNGDDPDINFKPSTGNIIDVVVNASTNDYCIRVYNPGGSKYKDLTTAAKKESNPGVCATNPASSGAIANAPSVTVSVFAGASFLEGGSYFGYVDATGANARFRYPHGLDIDSLGNVYVADHTNHRIRKITPSGTVSTLAGSTFGSTNGTGASAQFEYPLDVAVDSSDNVFVVEENCRIRKVTPAGVVTLFAGTMDYTFCGYVDAVGTDARFAFATNIAIDGADNLYVADTSNKRIRKVTPAGVVTTLAGSGVSGYADGVGAAAQFGTNFSVGADDAGNVYVSDRTNSRIRKVSPAGVVTTLAGSGVAGYADAVGTAAQFVFPGDIIAKADGTVYVTDRYRVRKILPDGTVLTIAGSGLKSSADGISTAAGFYYLVGITMNNNGTMYVSEMHRIRKIE